ncbi:hypothetical protein Aperf_G00000125942 [Anoplocephala perfoliata]
MQSEPPRGPSFPSAEEIEEQCRRIGMAGLYIADLTPQPGTSFGCTNSNISRLEHPDSSTVDIKSETSEGYVTQNTFFNQDPRDSSIHEAPTLNSVSFPGRSLSDPVNSFPTCTEITCRVAETPEKTVNSRPQYDAPNSIPNSVDTGTFHAHFHSYVHRITSDGSAFRSRSASSRLSVQPPGYHRCIRFRRSRSSHSWRRFRHSSPRLPSHRSRISSRTPRRNRRVNSEVVSSISSSCDIVKDVPTVLKPPTSPSDATGSDASHSLANVTNSSARDDVRQRTKVSVEMASLEVASPSCRYDFSSVSSSEEIHPLPPLTPPAPSSTAPTQVHFGTVRLRKHASSPAGQRKVKTCFRLSKISLFLAAKFIIMVLTITRRCLFSKLGPTCRSKPVSLVPRLASYRFVSRRRHAVYLPRSSPRRRGNHRNQLVASRTCGEEADTSVPSISTGPVPYPHLMLSAGRRKRRSTRSNKLPQSHLVPNLRLPAFPPDMNSLDHAYSSPIRHELLPRPDTGVIRNGESEISTTTPGMSRPTTEATTAQAPIPSDRTLSLELQSGSINYGSHQSASSTSIYELVKRPPECGSHNGSRCRSLSVSSMHSEAFCAKKLMKKHNDKGELQSSGRAVSLEFKVSSGTGSISKENQQSSSHTSVYHLVREPPGLSHPTLPTSESNRAASGHIYARTSELTGVTTSESVYLSMNVSSGEPIATTTMATPLGSVNTSIVASGSSNIGRGVSSSSGGGFASSFGGLSVSASRDRVFTDISGSLLRHSQIPGRFDSTGLRRGVGIRGGRRRVRHCTIAYRVRLFPFWQRRFLIKFDRLQLSALFDRKPTWPEVLVTLLLTTLVSVFASLLLSSGAFHRIPLSLLCCVVAGCHYSLIKSVQPDPASPRHGFNRLIIYSRALVFCLLGCLFVLTLLLVPSNNADSDSCPPNFIFLRRRVSAFWLNSGGIQALRDQSLPPLMLYGWKLEALWILCLVKDISGYLILAFPLIFLFGLVPQANTLVAYVLEQIDIHLFGASGSINLISGVVSVFRSCLVIAVGFGFCYAAALHHNPQDVFFSTFWGLYLPICFLLSRTPNSVGILRLIFIHITSTADDTTTGHHSTLRRISQGLQKLLITRTSLETSARDGSKRCPNTSATSSLAPKTSCGDILGENEGVFDTPMPSCSSWLTATPHQGRRSAASASGEANRGKERSRSLQQPPSAIVPSDEGSLNNESPSVACIDSDSRRQSLHSSCSTGNLRSPPQLVHTSSSALSPVPESLSPTPSPPLPTISKSAWSGSPMGVNDTSDLHDPLPGRIVAAMLVRIRNDLLLVLIWGILGFAVHVSTVFTVATLQPALPRLLTWLLIVWGFLLHYVWPQLRKPFPWLLFTHPICPPAPDGRVTAFEVIYHWCHWLERYFLVPAVTMATATKALIPLCAKFGPIMATIILLITSMKLLRHGFSGATRMFLNFFFAEVLFTCDFPGLSETFPLDYFFVSIFLAKVAELWNKLSFVYIYIAPFQASWGSICHAVAQLASIPQSDLLALFWGREIWVGKQSIGSMELIDVSSDVFIDVSLNPSYFISTLGNCIFSTLLSAPLEPFVASVFFITSYARPIRFWEATQKIHRIESTNTSLLSQLRGVSFEQVSANLNAIFYEHIARCLQQRLAGDIALGHWSGGAVSAGDIFILASEDLHFLLHIVEVGNGLVTFQMRGLEFAGTYCHEQESNGLSEPQLGDRDCCCCRLRHLPASLLSPNAAFRLRWLAWQFVYTPYTIEAYRLIDHSAATSLQVIDFRKIVLALFIQCLLYFTARLPNLSGRLQMLSAELTERFVGENKADLDPAFSKIFDEDFDESVSGVTRAAFIRVYAEWIRYCLSKCRENRTVDASDDSDFLTLCYAISLLGRRCLGGVSGHLNNALETFLHYLHDVFKGDVQISAKDDWVFADVELLNLIVTPAMRVALKLYQDHFTWNPLSTNQELYHAIWSTTENVVICHETDPQWRSAVLNDAEKLFSFRRIDSGTTQQCFRFIMMNKQILSFQIIKLNSECVRGFWAGQLREQIFLRNKNAERGSIQHAKHVLRNLINSSCDQPVGYPIYVSPLITSFAESHSQYRRVACPNFSIAGLIRSLWAFQNRIKQYCRQSYRCGGAGGPGTDDVELHRLQTAKFPIRSSACQLKHSHGTLCYHHHHHQTIPPLYTSLPRHYQHQSHIRMGYSHQSYHNPRSSRPGGSECGGGSATSSLLAAGGSELASWCAEVVANAGTMPSTSQFPSQSSRTSSFSVVGLAGVAGSSTTAVVHQTDISCRRVKIIDPNQILNDRLLKLEWPSHSLLAKCLPQSACPLSSLIGVEGTLIHRWTPSNIDPRKRSFCHRNIALITFPDGPMTLEGHCVAIWEDLGLEYITPSKNV